MQFETGPSGPDAGPPAQQSRRQVIRRMWLVAAGPSLVYVETDQDQRSVLVRVSTRSFTSLASLLRQRLKAMVICR